MLPGLATLVGCDVLTYNEIGPARGQTRYADYPAGALDPATQPVFAAHVHEHPLVNHYRATGSGEPVMISDFLTQQRFHRLGLYAEFFRAIPVEHQMASQPARPRSAGHRRRDEPGPPRLLRPGSRPAQRAPDPVDRRPAPGSQTPAGRQALTAMAGSGLADLTEREIQILRLVADGRTNTAIAHALEVSPRTVAKHLEHIYRKLGVSSRAAAVSRMTMPAKAR